MRCQLKVGQELQQSLPLALLGLYYAKCLRTKSDIHLFRRESVYCLIIGTFVVTIPLCLNGAIGAQLHVPFPVGARAGFGFYFSRFAVVVRMITALFWHGK